jgi:hypothetical protein
LNPLVAQLFVPGHGLGHTLGERLALESTSWANPRFTPPLDLTLPMAVPCLVEAGVEPAPDGLGPPLVKRLLRFSVVGDAVRDVLDPRLRDG